MFLFSAVILLLVTLLENGGKHLFVCVINSINCNLHLPYTLLWLLGIYVNEEQYGANLQMHMSAVCTQIWLS